MNERTFDLGEGRTLHRWENSVGEEWACCVYDHGPFCRLCQPVDDTLRALLEGVEMGLFQCKQDSEGQFSFRPTQLGSARAEDLIHNDPEMAAMYADLQKRHR